MKMMAQMNNDDDDIGSSDLGDEYFTKQLTPELPMTLLEVSWFSEESNYQKRLFHFKFYQNTSN